MKALIFHIGHDRYGLRLGAIVRVLPLLELKQLPLAPAFVAGLMDFHGRSVPVVDLSRLAGLADSQEHFDSRILVVDYMAPDGAAHLLGLLAEHVRGIQEVDEAALADAGVTAAPFLGQVASDAEGIIQLVELEYLLPAPLRAILFQPPSGGGAA
ncbi:MAG TPA: chemotaxis protein CheW [Janthinobacterium sp.]|jgi:chemotaxis-related protein WspB|nr:chemotaxis protein CheW [Janthinobacterium sp.]